MRHIPARGRNPKIACAATLPRKMCHIPTRGRKRIVLYRHYITPIIDASHPREGTETSEFRDFAFEATGCVTSPRGDGNTIALRVVLSFIGCVTSPPGDGNPVCQPMLLRTFPGCVTSPSPQGDENGISYSTGCSHAVDTSYPPQGDESLPKRSLPIALRRIRHIPARGRKRHSVQGFLDLVPRCTISPPGDGNTRRAGLAQ